MFRRKKDKSGIGKISMKEIDSRADGLERRRISAMAMLKSLEKQREKYIESGRNADQLERRNIAFRIKSIDSEIASQKKLLSRLELGSAALQKLKTIKTESSDLEEVKKVTSDVDLEELEKAISEKSLSEEEMLAKLTGIASLDTSSELSVSDPLDDYMHLWDEADARNDGAEKESVHSHGTESGEQKRTESGPSPGEDNQEKEDNRSGEGENS